MENSNSLSIVQIIDHLGPGGAQRQFVELAIGLQHRGHKVLVVALNDEKLNFARYLTDSGVELKLIPQHGKFDFSTLKRLYRLLDEVRPNIVQTWLFTSGMYARPCARLSSLLHCNPCKIITSVRSSEPNKKRHYVWVDRLFRTITDAFIVNVTALSDMLKKREKVAPDKIHTIRNGIDFEYFSSRQGASIDDRKARFLRAVNGTSKAPLTVAFIGRLSPEKRPDLFIDAAVLIHKTLPDVRFVMVGSGDQKPYRQMVKDYGLQDVLNISGFSHDMAKVLESIDMIVSCSDYEGCSNTLLEAMAANVPIVATSVGGNSELIKYGCGTLVPANSAITIADAVRSVISKPTLTLNRLASARARVQSSFSRKAMIDAHERLYGSLLSDRNAA